jgi:hypothetical protein
MKITLDDMRHIAKTGIEETRRHLEQNVPLNSGILQRCHVDIHDIHDDARASTPKASFYNRPKNSGLRRDAFALLQFISSNPLAKAKFVESDAHGKVVFHREAILEWMRDCRRVLSMTMSLVHFTSGQPSRDQMPHGPIHILRSSGKFTPENK